MQFERSVATYFEDRKVRQVFRSSYCAVYCTVSVKVLVCCNEPEVAITVTVEDSP